jgi:hypothetical protein
MGVHLPHRHWVSEQGAKSGIMDTLKQLSMFDIFYDFAIFRRRKNYNMKCEWIISKKTNYWY